MIIVLSQFKPEACGQTVLPDRSILIGQKLVENAKIEKLKCDIFGDFQTLWRGPSLQFSPRGDPKTSHDRTSGPVLHLYEASVGC